MPINQLDPGPQQEAQRQRITAQQAQFEAELARVLARKGQEQNQNFTSPWQVAGQIAQAAKGRALQGQSAQNYANLNAATAPDTGGQGGQGAPTQVASLTPTGGGDTAAFQAPPAGGQALNAPSQTGQPQLQSNFRGKPFSDEVKQAIREGSALAGVNPNMMAMFAHVESKGDPNAVTKSGTYKGLMQLSDEEMARVTNGQGNVWNPRDSTMAAAQIARENGIHFFNSVGRQADPFDLYMMHQQGPGGYLAHITNPEEMAWRNMYSTAEGQHRGPHWAMQAITENQGKPEDTSRQFIGRWRAKFDRLTGGDINAFADEGPVMPSASGAPTGGQPGAAGPTAAPGGSGMAFAERGTFVNPGALQTRPAPAYSEQQIGELARRGIIGPQQVQEYISQIRQAQQPMEHEFGGGTILYNPRNPADQTYIPKIQNRTVKVDGVETSQPYWVDSQGRQRTSSMGGGGAPSSGGQPGGAPSPGVGGGSNAFPANGSIGDLADYAERRRVRIKGEEELAGMQAKPVGEAIERGNTAQKEEQLLNTMDVLSRQTPDQLSGPLAPMFVELGKGLKEISGGTMGWDTAGAESVQKLNYALASLSAREITNRPALSEFRSMVMSNPGLANSPEGRAMLIDVLRQAAHQDVDLAKVASRVRDPSTWADLRDQYIQAHPLHVNYKGRMYDATPRGLEELKRDVAQSPPPSSGASMPIPQGTGGFAPGAPAPRQQSQASPSSSNFMSDVARSVGAGDNPQAFMTPNQSLAHAAVNAGPAGAAAAVVPGLGPMVRALVKKGASDAMLAEIFKLFGVH